MKYLEPQPLKQRYWKNIEAEIQRIFDEIIYKKIIEALSVSPREVKNSNNPLLEAIEKGTVWYDNGQFKGQFNSKISKQLKDIGASYNRKSKSWSYLGTLPPEISAASALAASRYEDIRKAVLFTLDNIDIESINRLSDIPDRYNQTIDWMEGDFQKTVKAITIAPNLTTEQKNIITAEWGQNLDKYVKDWTVENIFKLRKDIQENAFAGRRAESMIKYIQDNYQVSKRKARFLARQETSLLMSKFHETRYQDVGIQRYRWSTSNDERVRKDHKDLNNKIYDWSNPPIVDRVNGRRAHPGEDFGCRCVAIPILED